ncbi:MAG: O-antigen polymerase [Synergistaceae bacterium]|nr:O-antigen polymerase [Synergistaceae bacterium]
MALIEWVVVLGLYDLKISTLLKPTILLNIVVLIVISNFAILVIAEKNIVLYLEKISGVLRCQKIAKRYSRIFYILLVLGIFSFVVTLELYGFTVLNQNKVSRTKLAYGYFYNGLIVCCIYFYYLFRIKKMFFKRLWHLMACLLCLILLGFLLNRGSLLYIATGILLLETLLYYNRKKSAFLSRKFFLVLLGSGIFFIFIFGYVGELRFQYVGQNVYHMSFMELYGFNKGFPSGLGQIYIYLTSPLENFSYVLERETINNYHGFANLFYPQIKLFANLVGRGDEFAAWLNSSYELYPILLNKAGLNVMSFLADAYMDFGFLGILIYLLFYDGVIIFAKNVLKSKLYGISKVIIYSMLLQIIIWSPFVNSVFKLGVVWVNIFFIVVADVFARKIKIGQRK